MSDARGPIPNDDDRGAGYGKLIPEWSVAADDQVVLIGLAVVAALALALGWNFFLGGDGDVEEVVAAATTVNTAADDAAVVSTTAVSASSTTVAPSSTTSTVASSTTVVSTPAIGDVQAAVDPLAGDIIGSNEGTTAVLAGYVANQAESDEAEAAAEAVEGIEAVDNQLVVLEPKVADALAGVGVVSPGAQGVGTEITVRGTLPSEDARPTALEAAAGVDGVTNVIDELQVSVTADLNALPQVQFATGSAVIESASNTDLDRAAELIMAAGPDVRIEIQGYTDVRGPDDANQALSQARTDAVRSYLVDAGVDPAVLTAVGYGETERFAAGDSAEALAANRVVRFEQKA